MFRRSTDDPNLLVLSRTDPNQPEVGGRAGEVIVKVQTAQNDPSLPALIYDRARRIERHMAGERVAERMKDRVKAFFYAREVEVDVVLGDEAPDLRW